MTAFVIICAAMLAAALLWILLPLLRPTSSEEVSESRGERRTSSVVVALAVPAIAVAMYAGLSDWDWKATQVEAAKNAEVEQMLQRIEEKLASNPNDVEGWMLLGKSYTAMGRYERAVDAYQRAYELSEGQNVEAVIGLGEALALTDETSLGGRAGQLFTEALAQAPNHPKALWYGSVSALQAGNLELGRDRLQMLLAQNPPEQLRDVLERQIQDLDQQLGAAGEGAAAGVDSSTPQTMQRSIRVAVSIAPEIQKQLSAPVPLFIMARDPDAGGPPLAVQRHDSAAAPLTVELSERDAMMPTHTIASVQRVQIVARLSRSGTPQAQSGDFYGEAEYEFPPSGSAGEGTLNIIIDQTVP